MDWAQIALQSEIEYSRAYGGETTRYESFTHIRNRSVPFAGDFSRAVGVRLCDHGSFDSVVTQVETIHRENGLEKPNRYDIYPPVLSEKVWADYLSKKGCRLGTPIFFFSPAEARHLPPGVKLYSPGKSEYLEWYYTQKKDADWFDEEWFAQIKPLQLRFVETFKPYWLLESGRMKGSVYCANLGEYCRLFEVEIEEGFRGHGLGRALLDAIRAEAIKQGGKFVLLQSDARLRAFYEKAGFRECTRNSIIWLE